jgi:MoxR-like ATPase
MEEGTATVDGVTRKLPDPFVVIATENPYGSSGTQMLPESQLDRFMVCLSMGYPEHSDAIEILKGNASRPLESVQEILTVDELVAFRKMTNDMFVHDEIYEYIVSLVEATRTMDIFAMGASPRGTIALLRMAKAMAVIYGRDYVTAQDVQSCVKDVLGHRVKISARGKAQRIGIEQAMSMLLNQVRSPRN